MFLLAKVRWTITWIEDMRFLLSQLYPHYHHRHVYKDLVSTPVPERPDQHAGEEAGPWEIVAWGISGPEHVHEVLLGKVLIKIQSSMGLV